jgi:hypothetical protein
MSTDEQEGIGGSRAEDFQSSGRKNLYKPIAFGILMVAAKTGGLRELFCQGGVLLNSFVGVNPCRTLLVASDSWC